MRKYGYLFVLLIVVSLVLSLNSCKYFQDDSPLTEDDINNNESASQDNNRDNEYASLRDFEPWLTEIVAEDIVEIRIERKAFGLAPGTLNTIYYCNDAVEISRIINELKNMKMTPAVGGEEHIRGGGGSYYTITAKNGDVYYLSTANGFYRTSDVAYRLNGIPSIEDQYISEKNHSFSNYNYSFEIYTNEEPPVLIGGFDDLSSLEFSKLTAEEITNLPDEPIYTIVSGKFTLLIYSDTVFSYIRNDEMGYYRLGREMSFADYIYESEK